MLENLITLDKNIFLTLNDIHSPFFDPIMIFITGQESWYPMYAVIIGYLIYKYKWRSISIFIFIALTITAADQTASGLFKPLIGRLRPCHDESIMHLVHVPHGHCGGRFSFFSSHACNTFALAGFMLVLLKQYKSVVIFFFVWAALVSYSRIYVGVHFPLDLMTGAIVGTGYGYLFATLELPSYNKLMCLKNSSL